MKSPLDVAYNRLDEAHRSWHMALAGYHNVNDFRSGINSAIQALRNATFVLQKQKKGLPNFDSWYANWREKMKNDNVLKELQEARNVIVKESDLKLKSKAIAKISGWVDNNIITFEFNPISDSFSIAKGLYDAYLVHLPIKDYEKKRLIYTFERTWIYEKLPDYELLEAVAYAYNFLSNMIKDAERVFFLPEKKDCKSGHYCLSKLTHDGLLECMIVTQEKRTINFSLEDGSICKMMLTDSTPNKEDLKKSAKRYGDIWKSKEIEFMVKDFFNDDYPFKEVKKFIQSSIAILKKDKYLVPIAFIFSHKDLPPAGMAFSFKNQAEKILSINMLAEKILVYKGASVLLINEAWVGDIKNNETDFDLGNRINKKEAILITWASAEKSRQIIIPFKRSIFRKIKFLEHAIEEINLHDSDSMISPLIIALKKVEKS